MNCAVRSSPFDGVTRPLMVSEVMNSRYDFKSRSDIFSAAVLGVDELETADCGVEGLEAVVGGLERVCAKAGEGKCCATAKSIFSQIHRRISRTVAFDLIIGSRALGLVLP